MNLASALQDASTSRSPSPAPVPLTHAAEQAALRSETIAAFHTKAEDDEEEDELLVERVKTKDELEREEEEYREFLEREVGEDLRDGLVDIIAFEDAEASASVEEPEKKKKKKKRKKEGNAGMQEVEGKSKSEKDQEFLMKCVIKPKGISALLTTTGVATS
jgi:protein KRI1